MSHPALSHCAREVRVHDNDRFLTCLFAPADRREALFTVTAFNLEIARTRELVREPMMGLIRLQWWRDTIAAIYEGQGAPTGHEVARPLTAVIQAHGLSRRHFDALIDAREADFEDAPHATMDDLLAYAEHSAAPLVALKLEALDIRSGPGDAAARSVGIAWALTGLLRAVPFHLGYRRLTLPAELLARHGVSADTMLDSRPDLVTLAPVVAEIAALARHHLTEARRAASALPPRAVPALLVATLAELHLKTLERAGYDVFSPRVQARHPLRPLALAWRALQRKC